MSTPNALGSNGSANSGSTSSTNNTSNTNTAKFEYVTYIASTPERVWNALRDPEQTRLYWANHRNASTWKVGSPWSHQDHDNPQLVDIVGMVLESVPPWRLVLSWAEAVPETTEQPSRVTIRISPFKGVVILTVTHDQLAPGSPMLKGISSGWPAVLCGLKTLIETGKPLPMLEGRPEQSFMAEWEQALA